MAPDEQIVSFGPYGRRLTRREDRAIDVIVRHVIASLIDDGASEQWESYPEIGEHDWEDILSRVQRQVKFPDAEDYRNAYALLQARANATDA